MHADMRAIAGAVGMSAMTVGPVMWFVSLSVLRTVFHWRMTEHGGAMLGLAALGTIGMKVLMHFLPSWRAMPSAPELRRLLIGAGVGMSLGAVCAAAGVAHWEMRGVRAFALLMTLSTFAGIVAGAIALGATPDGQPTGP